MYKSRDLWYYFLVSNLQYHNMTQPINYAYLTGALEGGMNIILQDLVKAGLLQYNDLAKAEEIVETMKKRCQEREREYSKITK